MIFGHIIHILSLVNPLDTCQDIKDIHRDSACCGAPPSTPASIPEESLKIALSKELHMLPFSDGCPPGTSKDQLNGKCYNKGYHNGVLCGYSGWDNLDSLYDWDETTQSCVRNSKNLDDQDFGFYVRGALGTTSDWWMKNRTHNTFTVDLADYNGYPLFFPAEDTFPGLNKDGKPVAGGVYKGNYVDESSPRLSSVSFTDVPYSVEEELRAFVRRYPGMLPGNGDDYFIRPSHGAGPMIGAYINTALATLAERGLKTMCVMLQTPEYNLPGYAGDDFYEFNYFMSTHSDAALATYWKSNPATMGRGAGHAVTIKPWAVHGGLPLPTCTNGVDGVDYAPDSTDPMSPWVEYVVIMNNPTGERRDCKVPADRCTIDAAYNYAPYYHRAKLDANVMNVPKGSDGVVAKHIYYSLSKGLGSLTNRWGFATSSDVDFWNKLAKMYWPFRHPNYVSAASSWILMAKVLKQVALGPNSDFDVSQAAVYAEYDALMETYVPDSCECLEITNRDPQTRGVSGLFYWMRLKDACATLPTAEGYAANMYISLDAYLNRALKVKTAGVGTTIAGKFYTDAQRDDPASVWNKWSSYTGGEVGLPDAAWDYGSHAGAMGSWARYTRVHVMHSDDAYVKAYLKRFGYVCGVNPPAWFKGPVALAKEDPTIVVNENVDSGIMRKF